MDLQNTLIILLVAGGILVGNADELQRFYDDTVAATRQVATAGDLRSISMMLDYTYISKGRYPAADQFEDWMTKNFKENQIKRLAVDHWGNALIYGCGENGRSFTLVSAGPDGAAGTADDLKYTGP